MVDNGYSDFNLSENAFWISQALKGEKNEITWMVLKDRLDLLDGQIERAKTKGIVVSKQVKLVRDNARAEVRKCDELQKFISDVAAGTSPNTTIEKLKLLLRAQELEKWYFQDAEKLKKSFDAICRWLEEFKALERTFYKIMGRYDVSIDDDTVGLVISRNEAVGKYLSVDDVLNEKLQGTVQRSDIIAFIGELCVLDAGTKCVVDELGNCGRPVKLSLLRPQNDTQLPAFDSLVRSCTLHLSEEGDRSLVASVDSQRGRLESMRAICKLAMCKSTTNLVPPKEYSSLKSKDANMSLLRRSINCAQSMGKHDRTTDPTRISSKVERWALGKIEGVFGAKRVGKELIEDIVTSLWCASKSKQQFMIQIRAIVADLKRNDELRRQMMERELTAVQLCRMTPDERAGAELRAHREKVQQKSIQRITVVPPTIYETMGDKGTCKISVSPEDVDTAMDAVEAGADDNIGESNNVPFETFESYEEPKKSERESDLVALSWEDSPEKISTSDSHTDDDEEYKPKAAAPIEKLREIAARSCEKVACQGNLPDLNLSV